MKPVMAMTKKFVRNSSLLLVAALLLSGCNFSLAADVTPPPNYTPQPETTPQPTALAAINYPATGPDLKNGETIFAEKCAPCHGALGNGDGPRASALPDPVPAIGAAEISRKSTISRWFSIVTQGNMDRYMPPFDSLSDQDRWDVVAYALSLSASPETLAQGKEVFQANCANCHGEQGKGDGPEAANLADQPIDFTALPALANATGDELFQVISQGAAPSMPAFADTLTDEERWAAVDYLRALPFVTKTPGALTASSPKTSSITQTTVSSAPLGVISGAVLNESDRKLPAGQTIFLQGFDQQSTDIISRSTTLQTDGAFHFNEVEMPQGRHYVTWTNLDGMTYTSDVATVLTATQSITLPIKIFASTTDTSSLIIDRLHLFFEIIDTRTIRIIELYVISNLGDKTIAAAAQGQPSLVFPLPEGAANLEFQDGELGGRFLATADGFGDTLPIQPGADVHQVLFSFELPYKNRLELQQPLNLDSNAIVVLVPANDIQVKGDNLIDAGTRDVQGSKFQMYNISGSSSGDLLHLTISGQSIIRSGIFSVGDRYTLLFGLGALGAVLIFAGIILFTRARRLPLEEDKSFATRSAENAETLMEAILTLDDLYQGGKLPETAYRQRRAELKARLKEIMDNGKAD